MAERIRKYCDLAPRFGADRLLDKAPAATALESALSIP